MAYVDVRDWAHALHDIVAQCADKLDDLSLIGNRFEADRYAFLVQNLGFTPTPDGDTGDHPMNH